MCSAMNSESKPRSSIAWARAPGAIPSSVTNVEMPNFMPSLNHTEGQASMDDFLADQTLAILLFAVVCIAHLRGSGRLYRMGHEHAVDGGGLCGTRFSERAGSAVLWAVRSRKPVIR